MSAQVAAPGRVVLVHRYFAPDTPPYAHILEHIAKRLAQDGHRVTVLTCQPSYRARFADKAPRRERRDGYEVIRWPVIPDRASSLLKGLNLAIFCLRLLSARRHFAGADVVMTATTPPVLLARVSALIAATCGARFVYHKQDIYPEILPLRRRRSPPMRLLRWLDSTTEASAATTVVLSRDMAETVRSRHKVPVRIDRINNFDPWPTEDLQRGPDNDQPLRVVFAGNLGRFQGLDALLSLVRAVGNDGDIQFDFFGDGVRADEVSRLQEELDSVTLHGFRPPSEVGAFVQGEADLGVVCLEPGAIYAAYPSKTMTYLRNGCPLLVMVESSELVAMVEDDGLGVVLPLDDQSRAAEILRWHAAHPSDLRSRRPNVRRVYEERFGADVVLNRWSDLFGELVSQ